MKTITFNDYCEDFLNLDQALMSEQQLKDARDSFNEFLKNSEKKVVKKAKAVASDSTIEARAKAKMFGGKALVGGTAKQKAYAEAMRKSFIDRNTEDEIDYAVNHYAAGGFKFWIEAKNPLDALEKLDFMVNKYLDEKSEYHSSWQTTKALNDIAVYKRSIGVN